MFFCNNFFIVHFVFGFTRGFKETMPVNTLVSAKHGGNKNLLFATKTLRLQVKATLLGLSAFET